MFGYGKKMTPGVGVRDGERRKTGVAMKRREKEGVAMLVGMVQSGWFSGDASVGMVMAPSLVFGLLVSVGFGVFVVWAIFFGQEAMPGLIFVVVPVTVRLGNLDGGGLLGAGG